jgi:SAM-dependent methyltransferase
MRAKLNRSVGTCREILYEPGLTCGYERIPAADVVARGPARERKRRSDSTKQSRRYAPMPDDTKGFTLLPHDWHSTNYVAEWIKRDAARDPERRPLLQRMLSFAPFPTEAAIEVLDVGAGYGVVSEEGLQAFPAARITLQDYSGPMLDQARQRLAGHAGQLRYALCDLVDPSWSQRVSGPFDLAVSAIALHNLGDPKKIYACYRAIHDLLKPGGFFLNCDRFVGGVEPHLAELREAGFARVECPWQDPPRAIIVAGRAAV